MLRKVLTLSTGSLLGKLFGLAREILFAAFFGTSAAADAYRAAMTATLAPVNLFTSEALNATFIPQFRSDHRNENRSAWTLFNGIGITLLVISMILGAVLYLFASPLIGLCFPGFTALQSSLSVKMLKIMSFGIPLYVFSALCISLEIAHEQFNLSALRPLVQNAGIIIAMAIAFFGNSPVWIAWGFTGTYIVFSLSGALFLIKRNILKSGWYHIWNNHREVFTQFWISLKPMLLFSALLQCNIILEKTIASLIGPGAVAAIDYARMIPETAQLLLIVPLGMVSLSSMVTIGEDMAREQCDKISSIILILLVPFSGLIFVSAPDIINLLYNRGAFNENSILLTSQTLRGMAVGTWAVCLSYVLQKIYNARIRNREVLRIGAAGILSNALFNIVAYKYLGVLAIGIGYSLFGIVMTGFYMRGMGRLQMTAKTAAICFCAFVPYGIIGFLIQDRLGWTPLPSLMVQTLWTLLYWGIVFVTFPAPRASVRHLFDKLISLKQ